MKRAAVVLGLLLSAACVAWLVWHVDWKAVGEAVRGVGLRAWLLGSFIYVLSFLPRALRWQVMLKPAAAVPLRESLVGVVMGFAANNVLPMRLGEVVRAGVLSNRCGVSKVTGLASVLAEKILDGLCLLLALFVGLHLSATASGSTAFLTWLTRGAVGIFGAATLFLLAFVGFEAQMVALAGRKLPPGAPGILLKLAAAFRFLKNGRVLAAALGLTLVVWAVEWAVFFYFLKRLGFEQAAGRGLFCMAFVNLSILVPSAPGYIGVFQAGAAGAFAVLGLRESSGVALSLLIHSAQFIPVTAAGALLAPLLGQRWGQWYQTRRAQDA